jgi:sugar phosphate isomerase/epimerase
VRSLFRLQSQRTAAVVMKTVDAGAHVNIGVVVDVGWCAWVGKSDSVSRLVFDIYQEFWLRIEKVA